jgi:hypothetical protein
MIQRFGVKDIGTYRDGGTIQVNMENGDKYFIHHTTGQVYRKFPDYSKTDIASHPIWFDTEEIRQLLTQVANYAAFKEYEFQTSPEKIEHLKSRYCQAWRNHSTI